MIIIDDIINDDLLMITIEKVINVLVNKKVKSK